MIVRDEAENLPESLGKIHACFDEIIVVDTGSSDATLKIAESYGAITTCIAWSDNFSTARNISLKMAGSDWIMWFDADNAIEPEDVDIIRKHIKSIEIGILWCTEVVVPEGERLVQKRIFPNRPEVRFTGRVHEQLVHPSDWKSILLPVEIKHWGYADKSKAHEKGLRNLYLLKKMAAENPSDSYVNYQLGRTFFNLRRFNDAAEALKKMAPDGNRHAHVLLAQSYERQGLPQQAESTLKNLVNVQPDYGPAQYAYGRLLYSKEDYEKAAVHLELFLKDRVGDPVAGLNQNKMRFIAGMLLGRCRERSGRFQDAERAYMLIRSENPHNPEPLIALAALARTDDRPELAETLLKQCLRISPGNRRVLSMMEGM